MKNTVEKLIKNKKTIATMESCTGGALASAITNISGSSEILKFSAVTYSNEYKIKMGVNKEIIDKYSVYSIETAKDMSLKISEFTFSNYGIGITGKINDFDKSNPYGEDNLVFVSIYDRNKNEYHTRTIKMINDNRENNKKLIIENVIEMLNVVI